MTITLTREEAQQVHDALLNFEGDISDAMFAALTTFRARLAQPEPTKSSTEPVAWWVTLPNGEIDLSDEPVQYKEQRPLEELVEGCGYAPLYTAPPQREWQGLTDEETLADDVLRYHFGLNGGAGPVSKKGKAVIAAIEAKLKEKNT